MTPQRIGLTGSIGMGKSTTAAMFADLGVPVHDADATVHELYRSEAVPLIESAFPGTTQNGEVDRQALRDRVTGDDAAMKRLEVLVHPLVRQAEIRFVEAARADGAPYVVLDIPLLYETGADERMDATIVVTASPELQRQRVLSRPGMTEEAFAAILGRQVPDAEKRRRADFVVDTSHGLDDARQQVRHIHEILVARTAGENT